MTRFLQPRLTKKVCLTIVIAFLILIGTVAIFIFWNVRTPKLSHTESAFHMESVTQKVKNEVNQILCSLVLYLNDGKHFLLDNQIEDRYRPLKKK